MNERHLQALAVMGALLGACGDAIPDRCSGAPFVCPAEWAPSRVPTGRGSYEIEAEVVTDRVTGLMWQRGIPGQMQRWAEARAYCDELTLGGHDDWRLPSRLELLFLVEYPTSSSGALPWLPSSPSSPSSGVPRSEGEAMIDRLAFRDAPPAMFWSASNYVEESSYFPSATSGEHVAWTVDFRTGLVAQQHVDLILPRTRCVRAAKPATSAASPSGSRYVVSSSTVREPATGLVWARQPLSGTYEELAQKCASLEVDGQRGFRLPQVKEAMTLVSAVSSTSPHVDPDAFNSLRYVYRLWTSTPSILVESDREGRTDSSPRVLTVDVGSRGRIAPGSTGKESTALCVRDPYGTPAPGDASVPGSPWGDEVMP